MAVPPWKLEPVCVCVYSSNDLASWLVGDAHASVQFE